MKSKRELLWEARRQSGGQQSAHVLDVLGKGLAGATESASGITQTMAATAYERFQKLLASSGRPPAKAMDTPTSQYPAADVPGTIKAESRRDAPMGSVISRADSTLPKPSTPLAFAGARSFSASSARDRSLVTATIGPDAPLPGYGSSSSSGVQGAPMYGHMVAPDFYSAGANGRALSGSALRAADYPLRSANFPFMGHDAVGTSSASSVNRDFQQTLPSDIVIAPHPSPSRPPAVPSVLPARNEVLPQGQGATRALNDQSTAKSKNADYAAELARQVEEQAARKRQEKMRKREEDALLERDIRDYHALRDARKALGGAGEPRRDNSGKVIATRRPVEPPPELSLLQQVNNDYVTHRARSLSPSHGHDSAVGDSASSKQPAYPSFPSPNRTLASGFPLEFPGAAAVLPYPHQMNPFLQHPQLAEQAAVAPQQWPSALGTNSALRPSMPGQPVSFPAAYDTFSSPMPPTMLLPRGVAAAPVLPSGETPFQSAPAASFARPVTDLRGNFLTSDEAARKARLKQEAALALEEQINERARLKREEALRRASEEAREDARIARDRAAIDANMASEEELERLKRTGAGGASLSPLARGRSLHQMHSIAVSHPEDRKVTLDDQIKEKQLERQAALLREQELQRKEDEKLRRDNLELAYRYEVEKAQELGLPPPVMPEELLALRRAAADRPFKLRGSPFGEQVERSTAVASSETEPTSPPVIVTTMHEHASATTGQNKGSVDGEKTQPAALAQMSSTTISPSGPASSITINLVSPAAPRTSADDNNRSLASEPHSWEISPKQQLARSYLHRRYERDEELSPRDGQQLPPRWGYDVHGRYVNLNDPASSAVRPLPAASAETLAAQLGLGGLLSKAQSAGLTGDDAGIPREFSRMGSSSNAGDLLSLPNPERIPPSLLPHAIAQSEAAAQLALQNAMRLRLASHESELARLQQELRNLNATGTYTADLARAQQLFQQTATPISPTAALRAAKKASRKQRHEARRRAMQQGDDSGANSPSLSQSNSPSAHPRGGHIFSALSYDGLSRAKLRAGKLARPNPFQPEEAGPLSAKLGGFFDDEAAQAAAKSGLARGSLEDGIVVGRPPGKSSILPGSLAPGRGATVSKASRGDQEAAGLLAQAAVGFSKDVRQSLGPVGMGSVHNQGAVDEQENAPKEIDASEASSCVATSSEEDEDTPSSGLEEDTDAEERREARQRRREKRTRMRRLEAELRQPIRGLSKFVFAGSDVSPAAARGVRLQGNPAVRRGTSRNFAEFSSGEAPAISDDPFYSVLAGRNHTPSGPIDFRSQTHVQRPAAESDVLDGNDKLRPFILDSTLVQLADIFDSSDPDTAARAAALSAAPEEPAASTDNVEHAAANADGAIDGLGSISSTYSGHGALDASAREESPVADSPSHKSGKNSHVASSIAYSTSQKGVPSHSEASKAALIPVLLLEKGNTFLDLHVEEDDELLQAINGILAQPPVLSPHRTTSPRPVAASHAALFTSSLEASTSQGPAFDHTQERSGGISAAAVKRATRTSEVEADNQREDRGSHSPAFAVPASVADISLPDKFADAVHPAQFLPASNDVKPSTADAAPRNVTVAARSNERKSSLALAERRRPRSSETAFSATPSEAHPSSYYYQQMRADSKPHIDRATVAKHDGHHLSDSHGGTEEHLRGRRVPARREAADRRTEIRGKPQNDAMDDADEGEHSVKASRPSTMDRSEQRELPPAVFQRGIGMHAEDHYQHDDDQQSGPGQRDWLSHTSETRQRPKRGLNQLFSHPVVLQRGTPESVLRQLGKKAGPLKTESSWI